MNCQLFSFSFSFLTRGQPLEYVFPDLFKICLQPDISVSQMKQSYASFTRWLVDNIRLDWDNILSKVKRITLSDEEDMIFWKFGKNGCFSIKSVYKPLTSNDPGPIIKKIEKKNIPAKLKFFLWLVANNAILTKDNV